MENSKTTDEDLSKLMAMLEKRISRGESLAWDDLIEAAFETVGRQYTRQGLHKLRQFGARLAQAKSQLKADKERKVEKQSNEKTRLDEMIALNEEMIRMLIDLGADSFSIPGNLAAMSHKIANAKLFASNPTSELDG